EVAGVDRRADDGVAADAGTGLAGVRLGAEVAVVAADAVGRGRVRARSRGRVAGSGDVALVARGAGHRRARADAGLAGVADRAGVAVAARLAVGHGDVAAGLPRLDAAV